MELNSEEIRIFREQSEKISGYISNILMDESIENDIKESVTTFQIFFDRFKKATLETQDEEFTKYLQECNMLIKNLKDTFYTKDILINFLLELSGLHAQVQFIYDEYQINKYFFKKSFEFVQKNWHTECNYIMLGDYIYSYLYHEFIIASTSFEDAIHKIVASYNHIKNTYQGTFQWIWIYQTLFIQVVDGFESRQFPKTFYQLLHLKERFPELVSLQKKINKIIENEKYMVYPRQRIILTSGWSVQWDKLYDVEPQDVKDDIDNVIWTDDTRTNISFFSYSISEYEGLQLYINWVWKDREEVDGYFELELVSIVGEAYEENVLLETPIKQKLVEEFHKIVFYTSKYFDEKDNTIEEYLNTIQSKEYQNFNITHERSLCSIAFKKGRLVKNNHLYKPNTKEFNDLTSLCFSGEEITLFEIEDKNAHVRDELKITVYLNNNATLEFKFTYSTKEKINKKWRENINEYYSDNYLEILKKISLLYGEIDMEDFIFIGELPPTQAFLEEYTRKQAIEKAVVVEKQRLYLLDNQYKLAEEVIAVESPKEIKLKEEIIVSLVAYFLEKYSQERVFYKIGNVKLKVLEIKDLASFENIEPFEIVLDGYVQHYPKGLKIIIPKSAISHDNRQ
ncbi:MAG: hypothetical protein MUC49_00010 [Raineya sp.]|jgi:hypothetical protein|nr:hypothetical protein [Raineya sp.]